MNFTESDSLFSRRTDHMAGHRANQDRVRLRTVV